MAKCPDCKKELTEPNMSWTYGVFRVDAYYCDCGTIFREYTNLHVIAETTSPSTPKVERHSFILKLENGKWVKMRAVNGNEAKSYGKSKLYRIPRRGNQP